jgi:hypothetical protein
VAKPNERIAQPGHVLYAHYIHDKGLNA